MIRVLIIDDSLLAREYYSHIVRDAGFACVTAADGIEGLEKVSAEPFDIILTDVNMPGMDGYEFIRRTRQIPECTAVPIVIMSTEARAADRQKGIDAGGNLYLVKPTDAAQIVGSITQLLAAR